MNKNYKIYNNKKNCIKKILKIKKIMLLLYYQKVNYLQVFIYKIKRIQNIMFIYFLIISV